MSTVTLHGDVTPTTKADRRRAMEGAADKDRRSQAAYEAGLYGVPEDEHFAGRDADDIDEEERDAYMVGRGERMPEVPDELKARLARARERHARRQKTARSIVGTSGGYLRRGARSIADRYEVPTSSGGGSFVGVLVGILGLIALYLLLSRANLAATVITGVSKGLKWLVAPKTLPF